MKTQTSLQKNSKSFSVFSEQRLINYVVFKKDGLGCVRSDNPKAARLIDLTNLINRNIMIIYKIEENIIWFKLNAIYLNSVVAAFKKQKERNKRLF